MSYLKNLIKTTGNEFASIVEEGVQAADVSGYIDTGSYIFNALLSGSIYDGLPNNKITALKNSDFNTLNIFKRNDSCLNQSGKFDIMFQDLRKSFIKHISFPEELQYFIEYS